MRELLLVAGGGAVGSVARYGAAAAMIRWCGDAYPWGTLTVNVLGSLVIGVLGHLLVTQRLPADAQVALMAGFCGGFTTFSAFSLDTIRLLQDGHAARAGTYIAASVATCLLATFLGLVAARAALPAAN